MSGSERYEIAIMLPPIDSIVWKQLLQIGRGVCKIAIAVAFLKCEILLWVHTVM